MHSRYQSCVCHNESGPRKKFLITTPAFAKSTADTTTEIIIKNDIAYFVEVFNATCQHAKNYTKCSLGLTKKAVFFCKLLSFEKKARVYSGRAQLA